MFDQGQSHPMPQWLSDPDELEPPDGDEDDSLDPQDEDDDWDDGIEDDDSPYSDGPISLPHPDDEDDA